MSTRTKLQGSGLAALVMGATIALVVFVNTISGAFFGRLDLTESNLNTLSDASKAAVSDLSELEVTLYMSPDLPETVRDEMGRERVMRDVSQKFVDRLNEYRSYSDGNMTIHRVTEDVVERARDAKLRVFSGDEATAKGGRLEFKEYVLGATFHYKSAMEVLPLALYPEHYEFEITKIMARLKEKVAKSILMKDVLTAGQTLAEAVATCADAYKAAEPTDDAPTNPFGLLSKEASQARLTALTTNGEAIGGDHDAIGTNAVAEELKNAEGRLAGAKPDFQAEMRKHVHVWKLCGRDRRGSGIAAHLFDDREVLMDAEETIKDLGFKRGQMAEMREEDRQGRIALAPLRPVAARLGAMCLAIGSDLLFQSAGRAIAALNTPARLPPKAPTKENEEEKVHKRVAAVSKAVVRAASAMALRGCLSKELTALKARLCARPDWSDSERDEWRFVLTGEVGPATDPVEVDYTALKSGNNLVGGAKRRALRRADTVAYVHPHAHADREQVYYFTAGRGKMNIDEVVYEVQRGDAVSARYGSRQRARAGSSSCRKSRGKAVKSEV